MSHVSLDGDECVDGNHQDWKLEFPSVEDVSQSVQRLDQERYSCIPLRRVSGEHLMVGGGRGLYVCYFSAGDDVFWSLVGSCSLHQKIGIVVGGQLGEYLSSLVVTADAAIEAAVFFALNGSMSPQMVCGADNGP